MTFPFLTGVRNPLMNVMVRVTAPFFLAARLTFETLFETLKNKRYCRISFNQRLKPLLPSAGECAVKPCEDPALSVTSFYQHMSSIKPWPQQCHIEHHITVPPLPHVVSHQQAAAVPPQSQYSRTASPTLQMGVCVRLQPPVGYCCTHAFRALWAICASKM